MSRINRPPELKKTVCDEECYKGTVTYVFGKDRWHSMTSRHPCRYCKERPVIYYIHCYHYTGIDYYYHFECLKCHKTWRASSAYGRFSVQPANWTDEDMEASEELGLESFNDLEDAVDSADRNDCIVLDDDSESENVYTSWGFAKTEKLADYDSDGNYIGTRLLDYNNNKDRKQLDDYNAQRLRAWKKHGHNLNRYNIGDCE